MKGYRFLLRGHIGGRRVSSAKNVVCVVLEGVRRAWRRKDDRVAALLMLDSTGAFDTMSQTRRLHDLRKGGICAKAIYWIRNFMKIWFTVVFMSGGESPRYAVKIGIPQGSPISPILCLFYNADSADVWQAKGLTSTNIYGH